jgi:KipI family sensor histidine kinase inhibitor
LNTGVDQLSAPHARFILRPAGPRAILVEFDDQDAVRDCYAEARRRRADGRLAATVELVPAACTLLLDELDDQAAVARDLRTWRPVRAVVDSPREIEIPTVYDGPDLADVAAHWGVHVAEVPAIHAALVHEVAFIGFAPGFAYLTGLPRALRLPRRRSPRTRVPAGSVAAADLFTGVYPRESPGGWQLLGHTATAMWDPDRDPPWLLAPGDRVRFVAAR